MNVWKQAFTSRARLYRRLDHEFGSRTRFCAAASLVNSALAEFCSLPLQQIAFRDALAFLYTVGAQLQALNQDLATVLPHRLCAANERDAIWVIHEQQAVEYFLQQLRQDQPLRWARVIAQIDTLLLCLRNGLGRCLYGPEVRAVSQAFRSVYGSKSSPLSFGALADRIAIGTGLITEISRQSATHQLKGELFKLQSTVVCQASAIRRADRLPDFTPPARSSHAFQAAGRQTQCNTFVFKTTFVTSFCCSLKIL